MQPLNIPQRYPATPLSNQWEQFSGCHIKMTAYRRVLVKNVEIKIEDNILVIRVDLTQEFGLSASGKNIIIASTEGNVSIPGCDDTKRDAME